MNFNNYEYKNRQRHIRPVAHHSQWCPGVPRGEETGRHPLVSVMQDGDYRFQGSRQRHTLHFLR